MSQFKIGDIIQNLNLSTGWSIQNFKIMSVFNDRFGDDYYKLRVLNFEEFHYEITSHCYLVDFNFKLCSILRHKVERCLNLK